MGNLQSAHRGYEYQDLMVATRSVDLLLGKLVEATPETKFVEDDRFDDLTTVDEFGCLERVQFKHTDVEGKALSLSTFTSDSRQLGLDRLVACAIAYRDGPGSGATSTTFRLILRDNRPTRDSVRRYLKSAHNDPGPFLSGMLSYRMKFDAEELWPKDKSLLKDEPAAKKLPFAILRTTPGLTRADVEWFCEHFIVEVEAPEMSGDLDRPGMAETLLLNRVTEELGAGQFPNSNRRPVDVAQAIVSVARMARQKRIPLSANELRRSTRFRIDFGGVPHGDPVDPDIEVPRPLEVAQIAELAAEMTQIAKPIVIVGPPGQGKSWTCKQLVNKLEAEGWLVAQHYCFLGVADSERDARVYTETIYGTLLAHIGAFDPSLLSEQRPRFAASQITLEEAVSKSLQRKPDRPVALIVDGLDHVSRVAPPSRTSDPSRQLAEELAALALPTGSILIVLSQPGAHLTPLIGAGAIEVQASGFSRDDTAVLVSNHSIEDVDIEGAISQARIVDAIYQRSQGNALYSTYLCRELVSRGGPVADALEAVIALPVYDGSLEHYYQHLYESLGEKAESVAEYLAFLDFEITPREIEEIQPDRARHVRPALQVLGPVLDFQEPAGTVRIYHESFSRFLVDRFEADAKAINDNIARWLTSKGMFADERAYRFLIPALARAERHAEIPELVDAAFLMKSVAAGFPASAILSNLSAAVGSAAQVNAWPVAVRCIELARGSSTFEYERLDTVMVEFADVLVGLIGGEVFTSRLLFRGQPVAPPRTGLLLCAALDKQGVVVPWEPYIDAYFAGAARISVGGEPELNTEVLVAILRGQLRILREDNAGSTEPPNGLSANDLAGWVGIPESLQELVRYIDVSDLPADTVASAVLDTQGPAATLAVALRLKQPAPFALGAARHLSESSGRHSAQFDEFLSLALGSGLPLGCARILLQLGVPITAMLEGDQSERRAALLQLTDEVQHPTDFDEVMDAWLDHCVLAAVDDPIGLAAAEASIEEEFWYRNWLRFTIHVAQAEATEEHRRSEMALDAIRLLNLETNPFAGKPRACDLYPIKKQVRESIRRAVDLLDDEAWHKAFDVLSAMSGATSTTIHGELSGPFAANELLHLAVETGATPLRNPAVAELISRTAEEISAGRFYTDLAMFWLTGARLALRSGNLDEARSQWDTACQMLSGYGYRKDRTIFEILDPLPALIKGDPLRGREKVAAAQSLAERIPSHTDGSETFQAWSDWWRLLSLADPVALAGVVAPAMVSRCNLPAALHETAREHLWRAWQLEVEPVLANMLRITLDLPLDSDDLDGLERLLEESTRHKVLEAQVIAVYEETQSNYTNSSGVDSLNRETQRFHEINVVADRWNAPHISPWSSSDSSITTTSAPPHYGSATIDLEESAISSPMNFSLGMSGIAQALLAWRRPFDATTPVRDPAFFGKVIGDRLVNLIQEGRLDDAYFSLRSVAEAERFSANHDLLLTLAEGLECSGHAHFAAIAHTLRWTRSSGNGGWLTFGGETAIDSLCHALELDRDATLEVLAEETQRAVIRGNLGVTQALIYAFALADMPAPEGETSLDVAFKCWDEAASVISTRAPRVHPFDDPDEPYTPSLSDNGAPYLDDLDLSFALAIIAGVSNPGREQKRRSMLAVRMLLDYAPALAGQALQRLLPVLDDPATLVWIMRLIEMSRDRTIVVAMIGQALIDLTTSEYLAVRSLARRLVSAGTAPNLPATPPDDTLLNQGGITNALWLPSSQWDEKRGSNEDDLVEFLQSIAGTRIARGEAILPRLREATISRFRKAVDDEQFTRRSRKQADALGRANGIPDAYLAPNEVIESALQRVAAGGRLAMFANGNGVLGEQWEDQLAEAIMDDALGALDLEATRHPRPMIPIPPDKAESDWIALMKQASGDMHATKFDQVYRRDNSGLVTGTMTHASATCSTVIGGCYDGWRIIGSEEQRSLISEGDRKPRQVVQRFFGLELRKQGVETGFDGPPVSSQDSRGWTLQIPSGEFSDQIANAWRLVGCDFQMRQFGDASHGLGIPKRVMVPTDGLRAQFRLEPVSLYVLGDERGMALALITWRTEYQRSHYHLPWPTMRGSAIVARPDLLYQLQSKYGEQLILRDFIACPVAMIESEQI